MIQLLLVINLLLSAYSSEPAPNIKFETIDGKAGQLNTYKGKVVYLSVWASWCTPCLENYEKYESIREQLAKEGVILLNVSIDKNPELWKKTVARHSTINGINVLSSDIPELMRNYSISKVPEYHIIDKTGHFVYLSDTPGRDIISEFKKWL